MLRTNFPTDSRRYYIYLITNLTNGKQYVGSRCNYKGNPFITDTKYMGSSKYLNKSIEELGIEMFTKKLLEQRIFTNRITLGKRESYYMHLYDTLSPNGYNRYDPGKHPGFNPSGIKCTKETKYKIGKANKGNDYAKGHKHTEETKRKIREANKGSKHSKEHNQKVSEALKGIPKSEEHRRKNSEAQKGKIFSEEHRRKMSESRKGIIHSKESYKKQGEKIKGENHPMYGKHHSEETKRKMSESRRKYLNYKHQS